MTDAHTIRPHPDSSIDFDFHRAEARALRRQAMRSAGRLCAARVGALAAAVRRFGVARLLAAIPPRDLSIASGVPMRRTN